MVTRPPSWVVLAAGAPLLVCSPILVQVIARPFEARPLADGPLLVASILTLLAAAGLTVASIALSVWVALARRRARPPRTARAVAVMSLAAAWGVPWAWAQVAFTGDMEAAGHLIPLAALCLAGAASSGLVLLRLTRGAATLAGSR